ncbi:uncharacterized protein [Muntiacus reevesi]|uniref:uncharacterized protein n=1 Tax=Muntiacus reevesi TaxID=9886 RepID=UPI0033072419
MADGEVRIPGHAHYVSPPQDSPPPSSDSLNPAAHCPNSPATRTRALAADIEGLPLQKLKMAPPDLPKGLWLPLTHMHSKTPDRKYQRAYPIKERVFDTGLHGHPDQVPYIITWESLAQDPPSWVAPFVAEKPKIPGADIPTAPPAQSSLYPILEKEKSTAKTKPVIPPEDPVLIDLLSEVPPPYQPPPVPGSLARPPPSTSPEAHSPDTTGPAATSGEINTSSPVASQLRQRRDQGEGGSGEWRSQLFPLRTVGGPGNQVQYWPFSASDLYNWKTHNPPFSKDPTALKGLIESILLTHQPTWDDCQQLLQALLTIEERQRVVLEARKNVPGPNGAPTLLPNEIDAALPLTRPDWDYNTPAGREQLRLYRQVLLAGLKGAGRCPTNLAQVRAVTQGPEETPAAFLERLMEAYRMYTPFDPSSPEHRGNVSTAFIGQSAPDIRNKLQKLEGLQDYSLQDLMREAEKIYNKRETPEERAERLRKVQEEREDRLRKEQEEKEEKREKRHES